MSTTTLETEMLQEWQAAALFNPYQFFYFCGGVATGKTFTGSHFAILNLLQHPGKSGFIGANSFDQLSHATLRELFYWLNHYGFEFVIDKMPPQNWGAARDFKNYGNILTVRNQATSRVSHIFTRTLADADPLRGIEFSWFWLDETRDTPEYVLDVVISRMRETDFVKGMITSTPNGEDWTFKRFVKGDRSLYGSMHVETYRSVEAGIISEAYYQSMLKSYSPQLAAQELFAKHVNVGSNRAYYAASEKNKRDTAPWGGIHADPGQGPLIVGCDFNFSPAPCVWTVGQVGYVENELSIHWFEEIAEKEIGTDEMTQILVNRFPGFLYRVFGDASGTRGSTSNQGRTDYILMQNVFNANGCVYSIDVDQANPRQKDRVENMNRLFSNSLGEVRQTYNPHKCPLLDQDIRMVGWKSTDNVTNKGGRLDNAGDYNLTHASDGAGYACFKLLPPIGRIYMPENNIRRLHAELI